MLGYFVLLTLLSALTLKYSKLRLSRGTRRSEEENDSGVMQKDMTAIRVGV